MDESTQPWLQKQMDDLLLEAVGDEEQVVDEMAKKLRIIAQKAKESNVVFSITKMECAKETTFSGFNLKCTEDGVKITPDPKRTQAIKDIQSPKNRKELMSFMGAASQLAKWTPRYSFQRQGLAHL